MGDRDKSLCVCYKLNGKCSWLCEYFSNKLVLYCSISMFIMKFLNFGFHSLIDEHIKKLVSDDINYSNSKNRDEIFKIHIAYIFGIIYHYLLNLLLGISLFLLIINLVFTAIDYLVADHLSFIFVQFILGLIISFFGIGFIALIFIFLKKYKIKTSEDLDNLIESQRKQQQKLLKENIELKEKEEKLLKESIEKEIQIIKDNFREAMIGKLVREKIITKEKAEELLKDDNDAEDDK